MELGLSERGIYTTNELFLIGGKNLVDIYNYFENIFISEIISTYFLSLASIFFQYNIFAGILIAVGLFFYSRIAFLLSIIGYSTAYAFYYFIVLSGYPGSVGFTFSQIFYSFFDAEVVPVGFVVWLAACCRNFLKAGDKR